MTPRIGLYYPFIHFKDDAWLKLTALYWDKMGRIVPPGYPPVRDTETVRRLTDELGYIENFSPADTSSGVGQLFAEFIEQHVGRLQPRYDVVQRYNWPDDPITLSTAPPGSDPKLGYVFIEKIGPDLRDTLVNSGLGLLRRDQDPRWVGMHPRLAAVYMAALAEEMARRRRLHPVTDESLDHVAVGGWTIERLAQALLDEPGLAGEPQPEIEVESNLAMVAVQSVIPRNLKQVPVEKIIKLRKDYGSEMVAFRQYLVRMSEELKGLENVADPTAVTAHLEVTYNNELKPELNRLKKSLNSLGIDSSLGALNVQVSLPTAITSAASMVGLTAINPVVAAAGAVAFTVVPVLRSKRRQAQEAMAASPAAYLFHMEENLQPATLTSWITQRVRQFVLGV